MPTGIVVPPSARSIEPVMSSFCRTGCAARAASWIAIGGLASAV